MAENTETNENTLKEQLSKKQEEIRGLKESIRRMEKELNLAKDIQLNMIPRTFPAFPERSDFELYAKLIPAREVGGDFYDYYLIDEHHLAMVMADVSGKGVAAGVVMAICKALLKSRAASECSTASILTYVNNEMANINLDYMFVTVFMAILNTQTGELVFSNAGHNPTYIKRKTGELEKLEELHGPVVGAMDGIIYKESTINLASGDVLFAYTDGITEAHNLEQELYSDKRLYQSLLKPFKDVKSTVEGIFMDILFFERGAEQFDDITALCLEFKG